MSSFQECSTKGLPQEGNALIPPTEVPSSPFSRPSPLACQNHEVCSTLALGYGSFYNFRKYRTTQSVWKDWRVRNQVSLSSSPFELLLTFNDEKWNYILESLNLVVFPTFFIISFISALLHQWALFSVLTGTIYNRDRSFMTETRLYVWALGNKIPTRVLEYIFKTVSLVFSFLKIESISVSQLLEGDTWD